MSDDGLDGVDTEGRSDGLHGRVVHTPELAGTPPSRGLHAPMLRRHRNRADDHSTALATVLNSLDPLDVDILLMAYFEDLRVDQISHRVNLPRSVVCSRLSYGLRLLGDFLLNADLPTPVAAEIRAV